MTKPILNVAITTTDQKTKKISALFDSGSFYTIIRADCLPSPKAFLRYRSPEKLGTAKKRVKILIIGSTDLIISIGSKMIKSLALVAPDLSREMIIGAQTMQAWDINIENRRGKTYVTVGRDIRDPDIIEVA